MHISEIINHFAEDRENYSNAAVPPIAQSANFCYKSVAQMRHALQNEHLVPFYTRGSNPTTDLLRKKLAALEHTEDSLLFASGSAAIAAAIMANVAMGDHVVCIQKPYSWTAKLLNNILGRFGVTHTMVNGRDFSNIQSAIKSNTKVIFLESPNSWTFEMQDLEAVADLARAKGILTMIDNSYASPILSNPADFGIDIILHSATKYIGGHSDAVAGVLCCSHEMSLKIFKGEFMTLGGTLSPFNAWLLLRGLRTLPLRIKQAANNASALVSYLENHPMIEKVYFPFSSTYEQNDLAKKYMKGNAGQFTITLKTKDAEKVEKFCNAFEFFLLGCSWGGYESLAFPAITLYDSMNYNSGVFPPNMIRFYAGLEEKELLLQDFEKAFRAIQ